MRATCALSAWTVLVGQLADASWSANLNYRSPSDHHPSLGVAIHKVAKRNEPGSCFDPSQLKFTHGVASGDPFAHSVILWTRLSPHRDNDRSNVTVSGYVPLYDHETAEYVKASKCPACADYTVAADADMTDIVDRGRAYTTSDIDYTIKVEAQNLDPFTRYYYQFKACNSDNVKSPLGRTKTAPRPNDDITKVGLAVYSCSNYPFGYFNAFGNPVHKDSVDYVIHLGDYIYEFKNGFYGWGDSLDRVPLPDRDLYTLYDYRKRLAQYRTDEGLLLSHQMLPWIPVWDDHEVGDNVYRDGFVYLRNNEESFIEDGGVAVDQRKMNAVRAYFEWMPIRQIDMDDNLRVWRTFRIGKLFDLIMLDTRVYDRSITDLYDNTAYIHAIADDASRTLMGPRQENWFYRELSESYARGATWRIIGNQIVFSRINWAIRHGENTPFAVDGWDGYVANRNRTLAHLYKNGIDNTIMLSGDSHANWVADLAWRDVKPYDSASGEGAIGVEFAGTAVSSPAPPGQNVSQADTLPESQWLIDQNPELKWQELFYRGYYELQITPDKIDARYFGTPMLRTVNPFEITLANFTVRAGANRLQRPVAGGVVEFGIVEDGRTVQTNWTINTKTGEGFVSHFGKGI